MYAGMGAANGSGAAITASNSERTISFGSYGILSTILVFVFVGVFGISGL